MAIPSALVGAMLVATASAPGVAPPVVVPDAPARVAIGPRDWLFTSKPDPDFAAHLSLLGPFATGSVGALVPIYFWYFFPSAAGGLARGAFYNTAPLGLGLGHAYAGDFNRAFDVGTRGLGASAAGQATGTAVDWLLGVAGFPGSGVFANLGTVAGPFAYGGWAVRDAYVTAETRRKALDY
ncbi:MAG: hypothetical protein ACK46X_07675 [Candidatus Sericytochromatia bacterium]